MAESNQNITDFKSWADAKFKECKDEEYADHLCSRAIEENKINILNTLIYLKYTVRQKDMILCISKNHSECLKILLDHFKPDKREIEILIYESQQNRSYDCNGALVGYINKTG